MSQESSKNTRPIGELTAGDHISDSQGVHEIVHVLGLAEGSRREITLTLRPLGPGRPWLLRHPEGTPVPVASPEEISDYADMGRRQAVADALHQLATDIVEKRLPLPNYTVFFSAGVVESRTELDRWADYLGAQVRGGTPGDPIPSVTVDRPVAGRLSMNVHAQCQREPEPVVEFARPVGFASDIEQAERDALTASEPEHYHAAGAGGKAGACSAVCACGVTFAGFDTIAEAVAELDKHIANPEPEGLDSVSDQAAAMAAAEESGVLGDAPTTQAGE